MREFGRAWRLRTRSIGPPDYRDVSRKDVRDLLGPSLRPPANQGEPLAEGLQFSTQIGVALNSRVRTRHALIRFNRSKLTPFHNDNTARQKTRRVAMIAAPQCPRRHAGTIAATKAIFAP